MELKFLVLNILIFQAVLTFAEKKTIITENKTDKHFFEPASEKEITEYGSKEPASEEEITEYGSKEPASEEEYTDCDDIEESEDKFRQNDKELDFNNIDTNPQQKNTTSEPSTYAVTENIDDIPNNTPIRGPIVTNHSIAIPLNTVRPPFLNTTNAGEDDDQANNTKPSSRKNYLSVFHIKAEYDSDKPQVTVIQNNIPFPQFNGLREYIKGIRQGIVNGFQSFFNGDKVTHTNEGLSVIENAPNVHNIVNAPVVFLHKLQNKSSDVVRKVHEGLFGRQV